MRDFDIAIIGSGFAGSLLAMIARRLDYSVILLERGRHPRFAIGESTSPLANLLLEELARRYDLPRLLPFTSYGLWQRTYPQVVCGLKRGFTFFHHEPGKPWCALPDRSNQLAVAASPCDELADTHWLRADVDQFFVHEAIALGAEYQDETLLTEAEPSTDNDMTLRGERHGSSFAVRARFVIDATGPRGFLSRTLGLREASFPDYPATETLFSHFRGVRRCDRMDAFRVEGTPPYPLDDAALHHVFPGGWMWILRFNNGVTSAGVALTRAAAEELKLSEGESTWPRFLRRFPTVEEQFAEAEAVEPFRYSPALAYRCSVAAGQGWALLPSAAAFVDPLFSTGIPLTLLGIERLSRLLEDTRGGNVVGQGLRDYGRITLEEADWVARYIGTCYAAMPCFDRFVALSHFYFAAASFAEMARRLGQPQLARCFLAGDDPGFRAGVEWCAGNIGAPKEDESFRRKVAEAIAPRNIAGLHDPEKRNWYEVDLSDVVRGAAKLALTQERLREIIDTAPWAQTKL